MRCCRVQCRLPCHAARLHVGPGAKQHGDDIGVAVGLRGVVQRREAIGIDQGASHGGIGIVTCCIVQRRCGPFVTRLDVGPGVEQQGDNVGVTVVPRGGVQRRDVLEIPRHHVGARFDERGDYIGVAVVRSRPMQRCPAVLLVPDIDAKNRNAGAQVIFRDLAPERFRLVGTADIAVATDRPGRGGCKPEHQQGGTSNTAVAPARPHACGYTFRHPDPHDCRYVGRNAIHSTTLTESPGRPMPLSRTSGRVCTRFPPARGRSSWSGPP